MNGFRAIAVGPLNGLTWRNLVPKLASVSISGLAMNAFRVEIKEESQKASTG